MRWILAVTISILGGVTVMSPTSSEEYTPVRAERDHLKTREWVMQYSENHMISKDEVSWRLDLLSQRIHECTVMVKEIKEEMHRMKFGLHHSTPESEV